jgi:hypothetical protein
VDASGFGERRHPGEPITEPRKTFLGFPIIEGDTSSPPSVTFGPFTEESARAYMHERMIEQRKEAVLAVLADFKAGSITFTQAVEEIEQIYAYHGTKGT